jgi:hypothetical protein
MVSMEFFSDIILLVALCPWGRLSLEQKWVPGVFPGCKGGRCVRLTALPPFCAVVMKSENLNFLEPSGALQACNGTALPFIYALGVMTGRQNYPEINCSKHNPYRTCSSIFCSHKVCYRNSQIFIAQNILKKLLVHFLWMFHEDLTELKGLYFWIWFMKTKF